MSLYYQLINIVKYAQNGTFPSKLLILLVALGILLIIVLVVVASYIVLKMVTKNKAKTQESIDEKQKVDTELKEKSNILPNGTSLKDGLYTVEKYLRSLDHVNYYRVKRTQPLYLCSHCNAELDDEMNAFCRACGAALSVIPPTFPTYLLKESEIETKFITAQRVLGMNLNHSSLILPIDALTDSTSDSPKYYLLEPFDQEPTLAASQFPEAIDVVLDIGVNLAEGLAYLHNYSVVLKRLELDNVVYLNDKAKWLSYENVHLLSSEEETDFGSSYSENVRKLTLLLEQLLVGNSPDTVSTKTPDSLQELIDHYSNAAEAVTAESLARSLRQANRMLGGHNQVQYSLGAKSDVGRLRKLNEDSMLTRELSTRFQDLGVTVLVSAVADGVGGHAAGDVASQLTVSTLEEHIEELLDEARSPQVPDPADWIITSANAANERVHKERTEAGNNMACTLVLTFFTGDLATILNVGDSRAYLLNERGIRQLTTDHSLVERLVAIGEITREEARHHPRKSVIYRVIGDRLILDYDIFTQQIW